MEKDLFPVHKSGASVMPAKIPCSLKTLRSIRWKEGPEKNNVSWQVLCKPGTDGGVLESIGLVCY